MLNVHAAQQGHVYKKADCTSLFRRQHQCKITPTIPSGDHFRVQMRRRTVSSFFKQDFPSSRQLLFDYRFIDIRQSCSLLQTASNNQHVLPSKLSMRILKNYEVNSHKVFKFDLYFIRSSTKRVKRLGTVNTFPLSPFALLSFSGLRKQD